MDFTIGSSDYVTCCGCESPYGCKAGATESEAGLVNYHGNQGSRNHAFEDAVKATEVSKHKTQELSVEICILKGSFNAAFASHMLIEDEREAAAAHWEQQAMEVTVQAKKANEELGLLKSQLGQSLELQLQLKEVQTVIEKLNLELLIVKEAESNACMAVEEAQLKLERAEAEVERDRAAENQAFESLISTTVEIEDSNLELDNLISESKFLSDNIEELKSQLRSTLIIRNQ